MNKQSLLQSVIDYLIHEMDLFLKAARSSLAEATHEQNKAEDKYDTRGLEASYLARGQSRQVAELEQAISRLEKLEIKSFSPKDPIDLTAFIELESSQEKACYFMAPTGGGTEVTHEGKNVLVITPQSPLGQQLVGKKQGQDLLVEIAGQKSKYRVKKVA